MGGDEAVPVAEQRRSDRIRDFRHARCVTVGAEYLVSSAAQSPE
jgi:hypothetical protein